MRLRNVLASTALVGIGLLFLAVATLLGSLQKICPHKLSVCPVTANSAKLGFHCTASNDLVQVRHLSKFNHLVKHSQWLVPMQNESKRKQSDGNPTAISGSTALLEIQVFESSTLKKGAARPRRLSDGDQWLPCMPTGQGDWTHFAATKIIY